MFLLTFPISVPLWLLLIVVMAMGIAVAKGVEPLMTFWSAPPQRRRRDSYYGYGRSRHRPTMIHLTERDAA